MVNRAEQGLMRPLAVLWAPARGWTFPKALEGCQQLYLTLSKDPFTFAWKGIGGTHRETGSIQGKGGQRGPNPGAGVCPWVSTLSRSPTVGSDQF